MFGARDIEKLRAKRMADKNFSGRFGDIEIIEKNYCSMYTTPNLYNELKLVFRTQLKATEISH